jgi:hypothetical protein
LRLFSSNAYTVPVLDAPLLAALLRLGFVAIMAATLLVWIGRERVSAPQLTLEFGLVLIAMLLLSPLSEDIHYIYLVVPFTAMVALVFRTGLNRRVIASAVGIVVAYAFLSLPQSQSIMYGGFEYVNSGPLRAPISFWTGSYVYALLVVGILMLLAHVATREDRRPTIRNLARSPQSLY